jgi:hypothetical protein
MRKLTEKEILDKLQSIHQGRYDYSLAVITDTATAIQIVCRKHGSFWLSPGAHYYRGCPECGIESRLGARKGSWEVFMKKAEEAHPGKYSYDKDTFKGIRTKMRIICPVHGDFWQVPNDHVRRHLPPAGCPKCSKGGRVKVGANKAKDTPPQKFLNEALYYNAGTGDLIWKHRPESHFDLPEFQKSFNTKKEGKIAGTVTKCGYMMVNIGGTLFLAHRLIWKMVTGRDPEHEIDHIDHNRLNNRWANLREATTAQNAQNGPLRGTNTSGFKGVVWDKEYLKWKAQIGINYKCKYLGRFDKIEDAIAAYEQAAKKYFGEYAHIPTPTQEPTDDQAPAPPQPADRPH